LFGVRYEKNVKPSVSFNKSVYNKRVEIFNRHERAAITDRTKRKRDAAHHGFNQQIEISFCAEWLNRCRRLAKDWENLNRKALAFLRLASIRLMLRKLCNPA
jgi:transposase